MWSTPHGDRVIQGYEASLIRETVAVMIDELELLADQTAFPPLEFGISVWDGLTWQQKLATLDQVLRHLLQPSLPPLPLNAIYESAVGAIFEKIKCCIEVELDIDQSEFESEFHDVDDSWRSLVLLAFDEPHYSEDGFMSGDWIDDIEGEVYPTGPDDTRIDLWFNVVERLADRLLWDRDYEMEDVFADVEPDEAAAMKSYMGVSEGYYQHIAPDLRDDQVAIVINRVRAITHRS
jgi:hypothetical protein